MFSFKLIVVCLSITLVFDLFASVSRSVTVAAAAAASLTSSRGDISCIGVNVQSNDEDTCHSLVTDLANLLRDESDSTGTSILGMMDAVVEVAPRVQFDSKQLEHIANIAKSFFLDNGNDKATMSLSLLASPTSNQEGKQIISILKNQGHQWYVTLSRHSERVAHFLSQPAFIKSLTFSVIAIQTSMVQEMFHEANSIFAESSQMQQVLNCIVSNTISTLNSEKAEFDRQTTSLFRLMDRLSEHEHGHDQARYSELRASIMIKMSLLDEPRAKMTTTIKYVYCYLTQMRQIALERKATADRHAAFGVAATVVSLAAGAFFSQEIANALNVTATAVQTGLAILAGTTTVATALEYFASQECNVLISRIETLNKRMQGIYLQLIEHRENMTKLKKQMTSI